jgi:hypothetical protein
MWLITKKILNAIDLMVGHTVSFFMSLFIIFVTVLLWFVSLYFLFYLPFDGNLSLNELDNLELLGFFLFIVVLRRFFVRSGSVGESFSEIVTRYVVISAGAAAFYLTVSCLILVLISKKEQLSVSDFQKDDIYLVFFVVYLVALYALTPLPKLAWISKDAKNSDSVDGQEAEPAPEAPIEEKTDFFTDSTGNTRADSMNTDNKQ